MTPAVVLVHGAWHGPWCWERVSARLAAQGLQVRTVELPSTGTGKQGVAPGAGYGAVLPGSASAPTTSDAEAGADAVPPGLADDAAALNAALAGTGPAVVCGHSYGGMVISAADPARLHHLVYLCAFMPEAGESVESVLSQDRRAGWWMRRLGPWTLPDAARAPSVLYNECDAATQAWAAARLRPQAAKTFSESVADPAWRQVPSTYVICTRDRVLAPALQEQRFAPRAASTLALDGGHAPFLSHAAEVAGLLADIVRARDPTVAPKPEARA